MRNQTSLPGMMNAARLYMVIAIIGTLSAVSAKRVVGVSGAGARECGAVSGRDV